MSELTLITVKNGAIPYSKELKSMIIDMVNPTNHKFTIIDDYITVKSRYGTTSGELIVVEDIKTDITGKFVLVAEDIEDSGKTLNFLYEHLKLKNPRDVRFSVFIKRGIGYLRDYTVDVGAYTLSKLWLVGFGMDYYEHYRDLPYLAEVKEKFCQK